MAGNSTRGDIARAARGERTISGLDRSTAQAARDIRNETGLAYLEVEGAMMLADYVMQQAVMLDERRRSLAQEDVFLSTMLSEIEATAIRQAKSIQNSLYTGM